MLAFFPFAFVLPLGTLAVFLLTFDVRRYPVQSAILVGLCFAVAFYGLRLDASNDIARHMSLLSSYARVDFLHCFGAGHYDFLFVWDMWCWFIAKTGDSYLLQASAAFLGYSLIAYIPFDYASRKRASRGIAVAGLAVALATVSFMEVAIGIRSANALLICANAAYGVYVCGKGPFRFVMLALVAVMIHPVALLAIAVILVAKPVAANPKSGLLAVFIVGLAFAAIGAYLLPTLQGGSNSVASYLADAVEAFLGYSEGDEWTAAHSASLNTRVNYLFTFLWLALLVVEVAVCARVGRMSHESLPLMHTVVLVSAVAIAAFSILLESNGSRLSAFAFCLGAIPVVDRATIMPTSSSKPMFVLSCAAFLVAAGLCALHAYSVYYGIVTPKTFIASVLLGFPGMYLTGA